MKFNFNMNKMNRSKEILQLNRLSPEEVKQRAGRHLLVCKDTEEIYRYFAEHMLT
jgi:hypothetical protein